MCMMINITDSPPMRLQIRIMPLEPDKSEPAEESSDEPSRAGRSNTADVSEESMRKRIRQSTLSPHRQNIPQASPPRFVSVEELMDAAKGVTNMALAHEIVVNGGFQIKPAELPQGRCIQQR
ncbi:unnamed protein product [Ranitomeya imitator]|uniref:Uncharacterized protein n=1 Tax=Ranitomeya imitator TaxID=111125 RepID=A0ABN9L0I8_9NEOB|nr:unnamed protein product [Ranitomeya imitator]